MFFVLFHDFVVHFGGWRGSGWVLGALLGAPQGGRGAVEVSKKCEKNIKNQFFQKVVFRLEMDSIGYLVTF